jgi:hypothetical protein
VTEHKKQAKVIAFYLPQFHPIPENDEWWGKGFTEWTSVGKAKKYFIGHEQPRVPADLGYYDLRLPQVREVQAELAKEAGVDAFCYWHYWLGNGKQLLEMPLQEVIKTGKPDFPFCLGWANHSWTNKEWNSEEQLSRPKVMIEQTYPGKQDIDNHFYKMLPAFLDRRYFRIHEKLLFLIYIPQHIPDFEYFKNRWNELARCNGLPEFFFIAMCDDRMRNIVFDINDELYKKYDAILLNRLSLPFHKEIIKKSFLQKFLIKNFGGMLYPLSKKNEHIFLSLGLRHFISSLIGYDLTVVNYKKAIKRLDSPLYEKKRIYPCIIPNWDNSPRRGARANIYKNSTPDLFKIHVKQILCRIKDKDDEDKIVFLKSWNEWAEGNYLEPDLKWGRQYIRALRESLEE